MAVAGDRGSRHAGAGVDLMAVTYNYLDDPREREARLTIPVYGQLPFVPERASGL